MNKYLFFIGQNPDLTISELESLFGGVKLLSPKIAMLELKYFNQKIQDDLGGTTKIAEILDSISEKDLLKNCIEAIKNHEFHSEKKRIAINSFPENKKLNKDLLIALKKEFKSLRYLNNNYANLVLVASKKQIVAKNALELNLIKENNQYVISKTVSVQNPDFYSKRDFDKPVRDMQVGMLPPKLAQIMLNLVNDKSNIWDPFCGTGTILIEGLLQGYNVVGSDLSESMVKASIKNCEWAIKEFDIRTSLPNIFKHDAAESVSVTADTIVTEGYLGPIFNKLVSKEKSEKLDDELSVLYEKFFNNAADNNVKNIVLSLPIHRSAEGLLSMKKTLANIPQTGYNSRGFGSKLSSLVYMRPQQYVGREVFFFQLNS